MLLLNERRLVKTIKFNSPNYIGDPINAVKIFNDKEVDELIIFDIKARKLRKGPNFKLIESIVSEAFMPIGYGGGIRNLEDARNLFNIGIEKVILNHLIIENGSEVIKIIEHFGSQSVVACINYKRNFWGKHIPYFPETTLKFNYDIKSLALNYQKIGVGEIILQSVDKDGTRTGYDIDTMKTIANVLKIPLVIAGGASSINDFQFAFKNGASGVAAGSMFVYNGKHKAVLISYNNKF
ncbi:MAG: imidazole glycerol phosphate synthase subunit HisF [Bacteroidia bacterium]|nr:imidazole glycerol phosphate synthase subunit HisF [Bacteroidia bacterium]MCC7532427.1 imidazole glycerol phosphate synthase subunit HisF [Bacteroidia bacterium]